MPSRDLWHAPARVLLRSDRTALDDAKPAAALRLASAAEIAPRGSSATVRVEALDAIADAAALTGRIETAHLAAERASRLAVSQDLEPSLIARTHQNPLRTRRRESKPNWTPTSANKSPIASPTSRPTLPASPSSFPFGDIYSRPGLDLRSRQIATVAALCTMGCDRQLVVHCRFARNIGSG